MDRTSEKRKSKSKKESTVEIFGEDVDVRNNDNHHEDADFREKFRYSEHRHRGSLTWGLILILVGVMFLLSNFGIVPNVDWGQVARLWPVVIILIGIDTLMGQSEVADILSSLVGVFIFATVLGIVFIHTSPGILGNLPSSIRDYLYTVNNYFLIK
jgi:hypothetical protein